MQQKELESYNKALEARLKSIIELTGLGIQAFAEFTNSSESHIYAMVNGNKQISIGYVQKLTTLFNFTEWQFYNLNFNTKSKEIKTEKLSQFKKANLLVGQNRNAGNTFNTIRHQIEMELIPTKFFHKPVSVKETREQLKDIKPTPTSKQVSQVLNYLVEMKKLAKIKNNIITQFGTKGKRIIDYFVINSKSK